MRQDGPAKLDIEIKSDWLLICVTFVTKSPDIERNSPLNPLLMQSLWRLSYHQSHHGELSAFSVCKNI